MSTSKTEIHFVLNGNKVSAIVGNNQNIIELLNQLNIRGARESCSQGLCGACTVLIDDIAYSGCLEFAAMLDGKEVRTIEGLEKDGVLDPIQEAFIEAGAFQCGFCTPGFILMISQLLDKNPNPSESEIRHYLSGNLCRCGAYPEIIKAVFLAIEKRKVIN
jgi:aerobic carbon-monoxide dehydrogenase small subunit